MSTQNNTPYMRQNVTTNHPAAAIDTTIQSALTRLGPSLLVRIEAVHSGGVSLTGKVDVRPLVNQQDGLGRPYPRGIIHDVPYLRIQGGTSAVIIDPKPGDIGFIVISGRDHSHAVVNRAPSPPASSRIFSIQDCVYVGGFLNEAPNQYVQFTDEGIRIVTPGTVEIDAAGITANCDISTSGDVKAGNISLREHTHNEVQPGGGDTGKPQ